MKRVIVLAMGLAAFPAWAELPEGEWKTARPIALPAMSAPGLVYLPLDENALAVESLSEYRVVRGGGLEVPYRMVVEEGQTEKRTRRGEVISQGRVGKEKTQVTLDLGPAPPSSNRIELGLRGNNFRSRVRVEGSRDQREWWVVADKRLVYRHEGRFEQTRVNTPAQQYRFLRITVSRLRGPLPRVDDVQVVSDVTIPRKLVAVPVLLSRREDAEERRTVLDLEPEGPSRDLAQVRFEVEEAQFDRPVTIEAAREQREFGRVGSRRLRRVAAGEQVLLPLAIPRARRLRISIRNADDRPLGIVRVTLQRVRRGLIFEADPARRYELWYGRPGTPAPVYDIQRLPMTAPPAELPLAGLGPKRSQPVKPPPPPPWTERHPALFWGALAAVLVLLGLLILRAMRGTKPVPPGE